MAKLLVKFSDKDAGFYYLASPYSAPADCAPVDAKVYRSRRYDSVVRAMATLTKDGWFVFSPIAHCHEAARLYTLPTDAIFWQEYNREFIRCSAGMIIYKDYFWDRSAGIKDEIAFCEETNVPYCYMTLQEGGDYVLSTSP